ncbi:MAG: inositol monophosphatase family protein [bacterium]
MSKSEQYIEAWGPFLTRCADESDAMSRHYFEQALKIEEKKDKTLVTEADLAIERKIREFAADYDPELGVLGEEFGVSEGASSKKLIIDPIDGTVNFIRGIPIFGSLLAIEEEGEIVAAMVSNPMTKERWSAAKGAGAFFNEQPIQVSKIERLGEGQAFYGSLFGTEATGLPLDKAVALLGRTKRQRGIGDFLMHLWVAMGYGEFAFDVNLNPWDLAPLGLIVTEAGGQVTTLSGQPFSIYQPTILSSNGRFHAELFEALT